MSRVIGHGRYARETYPQSPSVGGLVPDLLSLPWTPVTAGSTFQPSVSQPWLAVDTSGGVQVTVEMPSPAADGQVLLAVDDAGNAAVNPILFMAVGGVTIADPQAPGTYAETISFSIQGGTVAWKFQVSTSRWLFFSF